MTYKCDTCLKEFDRKYNLEIHLKKKKKCIPHELLSDEYKNKKTGTNICEFCGNTFSSRQSLSCHRSKHCKKSPYKNHKIEIGRAHV